MRAETPHPQPGERLFGMPRERLAWRLRGAYECGATIAELAQLHGRSRGAVRQLLVEANTPLRPRGRVAANVGGGR